MTYIDYPQNPAHIIADQTPGHGQMERITLATTDVFPLARPINAAQDDTPPRYWRISFARGVGIQISSFGIGGTPTLELRASIDGLSSSPYYALQGNTMVSSFVLPPGGTETAPNSTLIQLDSPWVAYLQLRLTVADSTAGAGAFVSIFKRCV